MTPSSLLSNAAPGGKQGKAEKTTSKDSVTASAKESLEEKSEEAKGVGNTEDDEPW